METGYGHRDNNPIREQKTAQGRQCVFNASSFHLINNMFLFSKKGATLNSDKCKLTKKFKKSIAQGVNI